MSGQLTTSKLSNVEQCFIYSAVNSVQTFLAFHCLKKITEQQSLRREPIHLWTWQSCHFIVTGRKQIQTKTLHWSKIDRNNTSGHISIYSQRTLLHAVAVDLQNVPGKRYFTKWQSSISHFHINGCRGGHFRLTQIHTMQNNTLLFL